MVLLSLLLWDGSSGILMAGSSAGKPGNLNGGKLDWGVVVVSSSLSASSTGSTSFNTKRVFISDTVVLKTRDRTLYEART